MCIKVVMTAANRYNKRRLDDNFSRPAMVDKIMCTRSNPNGRKRRTTLSDGRYDGATTRWFFSRWATVNTANVSPFYSHFSRTSTDGFSYAAPRFPFQSVDDNMADDPTTGVHRRSHSNVRVGACANTDENRSADWLFSRETDYRWPKTWDNTCKKK